MFNSPKRPIHFPINRTLSPVQSGGDFSPLPSLTPEWQTSDPNEPVTVTMTLSLNEFVALASAIDVGRDIAFGDDAIELWYVWLRAINTMSICDSVADCIETSEAVQSALSEWLEQGGGAIADNGINTPVGTANALYSDDNLLDPTLCTPAQIMGQCIGIVEFLNVVAMDFIEGMIAFSFPFEFAGYIAQSIPLANALGIDFGDIVDWITDEILTQYNGAYDIALRNEAACLLYDRACVNCELTIDMVLDAFAEQISVNIDPSTAWSAFLQDLITLSIPDAIVYGAWQLILGTWKVGSVFTGISGIQAIAYSAASAPPIDPSFIGCDPCGTPASVPIISPKCDDGVTEAGIINSLGGNRYRVISTEGLPNDWMVTIASSTGGAFRLDNFTFFGGNPVSGVWQAPLGTCQLGFGQAQPSLEKIAWTGFNINAGYGVEFDWVDLP